MKNSDKITDNIKNSIQQCTTEMMTKIKWNEIKNKNIISLSKRNKTGKRNVK